MIDSILIITRNYPPQIGGLETFSYELIQQFQKHTSCRKIALSKPKIYLLWFYPYCLIRAIWMIRRHSILFVHLCDGVLAPLGFIIKRFTQACVTVTVHGLDITYEGRIYRKVIPSCVRKLDRVICPSRSTAQECLKRSVRPEKICVVPNGIRSENIKTSVPAEFQREKLETIIGFSLERKKVLTTIGRLVKRKGVAWFVECVLPRLNENYIYIIVGDGPEKKKIVNLLHKRRIENRVFLLDNAKDDIRNLIYHAADVFIMPNISVKNDVEGFGIVAIEAGAAGLPVVGSDIQGIRDAVIENETGFLVPEQDVNQFVNAITCMKLVKKDVQKKVLEKYSWQKIVMEYIKVLKSAPTTKNNKFFS